jgi:glutathione S-transferase
MPGKPSSRIVFYHNPQSRAVMVRWMLEECGAEYELRHVDLQKGENRQPAFLAVNPMGKIPAIVVDGTVITEVAAIIAWLADAYPDAGLAPPVGSTERGTWYRWLFFGGSCIEPAVADEMFKRPPVARKSAIGWGSIDDVVAAVEAGLQPGPWLLGERFSAADVYVGAELGWAAQCGVAQVRESKVIGEYTARCRERPAFSRAMD